MKIGIVQSIVTIEMGCHACGGNCVTDAGSYLITKDDKVVSCEDCYAQWLVTEDLFEVIPEQLQQVRSHIRWIQQEFPYGSWEDLSKEQLVKAMKKIYQHIDQARAILEKA